MQVGTLELDLVNQCLCRGTQTIPLTPKAFGVLRVLVEHRNLLVTKEALLNTVWPGARVEEGQIKQFISELRRLLQDEAREPRHIQTVHRRGYRWIGDISVRSNAPAAASGKGQASLAGQRLGAVAAIIGQAPVCVGREADLVWLEQCFAKTRQAQRQMCLVSGEPGIGKTTLIGAFVHRMAAGEAFWLLRGQCDEQPEASPEPYCPLIEALDNACYGPNGESVVSMLRQYAPVSLAAMPGHLSAEEGLALRQLTAGAGQERRLREYSAFFEALAAQQTVVLWLEDLQWADHYTLALLAHLARSPRPARLFLIASVRPKEMYPANRTLQILMSEARSQRVGVELELKGLGEQAVVQYVESRLPRGTDGALAQAIYAVTEGHPLFVRLMAEHAADIDSVLEEDLSIADAQRALTGAIPAALLEVIGQQLDALGAEAKELLEAASIAGRQFSAAELAAALEIEVEQAERRCEQLAQRHLFVGRVGACEWPDGTLAGEYRFLHNLCLQALYQSVPPNRRARMQDLIGKRIELAHRGALSRGASGFKPLRTSNDELQVATAEPGVFENSNSLPRQ